MVQPVSFCLPFHRCVTMTSTRVRVTPLAFWCCLALCIGLSVGAATAAPLPSSAKIQPTDLECILRGNQRLVGRIDRAKVWGRSLRTKSVLRLELQQLGLKLANIRGVPARNLKAKKRDLEVLLATLKECNQNRPHDVPVTPTPLSVPLPGDETATPIPATATASPTPTITPTPTATSIPTKVPVLIAQGHAGRLIMSCDDGRTWIHNSDQAVSPAVRCWNTARITTGAGIEVNGCTENPQNPNDTCDDCVHQNWAGRGLTYGNGVFVATWGWGSKPGKVQRSTDGVHWTTVINSTTNAGVRFGDGVFMTGRTLPYHSQDNGITWNEVPAPPGYNPWYNA